MTSERVDPIWALTRPRPVRKLDVAAGVAAPDLQSGAVLEECAELAEREYPATAAFTEIPLAHVGERRLATHARQLVVAAAARLTHVAGTLCPTSPPYKTLAWAGALRADVV